MKINEQEKQNKFNEEIAELLKAETSSQIELLPRLEVLRLDELPDLSEWRKP